MQEIHMNNDENPPDRRTKTKIFLDPSIETVEIDFSIPRLIKIVPINSRGHNKNYLFKITAKGGATLV